MASGRNYPNKVNVLECKRNLFAALRRPAALVEAARPDAASIYRYALPPLNENQHSAA
jgi:hypothetical protein